MKRLLFFAFLFFTLVGAAFLIFKRSPKPPASAPTPQVTTFANTPSITLGANLQAALQKTLSEYENLRRTLAQDTLPSTKTWNETLQASLQAASDSPAFIVQTLKEAVGATELLSQAKNLEAARLAFGEISRAMVTVTTADKSLREGLSLYNCPMAEGYSKWLQRDVDMANPYMGQRMLTCGNASAWEEGPKVEVKNPSHEGHGHQGQDAAYFTCPMHPSVQQKTMGKCPICGMDLTPVTYDELESGVVRVDEARRERVGIRVEAVKKAHLLRSIRAFGRVTYDESRLRDLTLRQGGYVTSLHVSATGEPVKKGQVLLTLSSPELLAAQQEYLLALQAQDDARKTATPDRADALVLAARQRLRLWDVDASTLEQIAQSKTPLDEVPFYSPINGYVVEKEAVQGAFVTPGQRLFRIASLDKVWVEADVFETDFESVKLGQKATISLHQLPGKTWSATVNHIHPSAQTGTRATSVRMELDNSSQQLRPDMSAEIRIEVDLGERLLLPTSAVLYTGPRWLVFVDLGEGKLKPQEVKLGVRGEDTSEVLEGVVEGQKVVTAGNFLVAAESRLKSASKYWEDAADE